MYVCMYVCMYVRTRWEVSSWHKTTRCKASDDNKQHGFSACLRQRSQAVGGARRVGDHSEILSGQIDKPVPIHLAPQLSQPWCTSPGWLPSQTSEYCPGASCSLLQLPGVFWHVLSSTVLGWSRDDDFLASTLQVLGCFLLQLRYGVKRFKILERTHGLVIQSKRFYCGLFNFDVCQCYNWFNKTNRVNKNQ